MDELWNSPVHLPKGETRHWEIGPLEFWVKRLPGEWQITQKTVDDESRDTRWSLNLPSTQPEDTPYRRFAFETKGEDDYLLFKPVLPDRAIVSRPEIRLDLPSGARARVFCGIPLWIEILAGNVESPYKLMTLPVRPLSRTWFGTAHEGEACYAATTRAVRNYRELPPYRFRVLCPVSIRNQTEETLPVERLCLRVQHLALFEGKSYLWSNRVRVTKSALHGVSRVTYEKTAPSVEPDSKLLAVPRVKPAPGGALMQTFNHLRQFLEES